MNQYQVITGLAGFFHNLFTVVWVGGLLFIVLTAIPAARRAFGKGEQTHKLMNAILRRNRPWVYGCIAGLVITGLVQARFEPAFTAPFHFDTPYKTLLAIKHLLTIAMAAVALFRSLVMGPKLETAGHPMMQRSVKWIALNAGLGVVVLALSSLLDVL